MALPNLKTKTKTDPKVDAAAVEKLIIARVGLLIRAPFFGNLATRLIIRNADDWCGTLATDGKYFYYNSAFVAKMPIKQVEFGWGHEVLHIAYDHMLRKGNRNHELFNIACDYVVNQDLMDQKIGEKIDIIPILLDDKYQGMAAEEVYDDLYKNAKKISISDLLQKMLDDHLEKEFDPATQPSRAIISDEERAILNDEIHEALISAIQSSAAGKLPAGIARMVENLIAPKMNWRELIQQQIISTINADYTFAKPSRRGHHMDAILPGAAKGEMIDICIALDMSGSIGAKECKEFFSEVYAIMELYSAAFMIRLWTFDTKVYNMCEYTQDNMDDILNYEPIGGGGTSFECNWEFMKEHDIQPKKFIMFTDGVPNCLWAPHGDEEYCDTVFIIHGNPRVKPPFGQYAHYD